MQKLKYIAIATTCLGLLFKGNHWPYAGIITTIDNYNCNYLLLNKDYW